MKTQNPWMGRAKGSAGSMTSTKINDKNVMKAKAFEVSNPNTDAQQSERNFFKQVLGLTSSFSQEQLRSLFGMMPKGMSRRNMLYQQISAAYTMNGNTKELDFSKLFAIGNGKTTDAAIYYIDSVAAESYDLEEDATTMKVAAGQNPNLLFVVFNVTKGTIGVYNNEDTLTDNVFVPGSCGGAEGDEVYFYPTVAENGADVSSLPFGNFALKTRPNKQGRFVELSTPSPSIETIDANIDDAVANILEFNLDLFDFTIDDVIEVLQIQRDGHETSLSNTFTIEKSGLNVFLEDTVLSYISQGEYLTITLLDTNKNSHSYRINVVIGS